MPGNVGVGDGCGAGCGGLTGSGISLTSFFIWAVVVAAAARPDPPLRAEALMETAVAAVAAQVPVETVSLDRA